MDGPPVGEATHQIEQLILAIDDLRRRVTALEASQLHSFSPGTGVEFRGPVADFATARDMPSGLLAGLGRALIAITGAFLLRAITEAGILPPTGWRPGRRESVLRFRIGWREAELLFKQA